MGEITLRVADEPSYTSVANAFIDHYMKEANGEFVKIYLFLLRCLGDKHCEFSISGAADALDHTQRDISRALMYWERRGLLRLEYGNDNELSGICLVEPKENTPTAQPTPVAIATPAAQAAPTAIPTPVAIPTPAAVSTPAAAPTPVAIPAPAAVPNITAMPPLASAPSGMPTASLAKSPGHTYSLDERELLTRETDVQEILFITERYLGHPLSSTEVNTVLYWYDGLHFSAELIEYLVEYCVELSHKKVSYMNKVAMNWAESGIASVEDAKSVSVSYQHLYRIVATTFGIVGRSLTPAERQFMDRWSNIWHIPDSLIEEACRRTILKTSRPSFQYADSILENWHNAGITDLDGVSALDASHAKTVKNIIHVTGTTGTARPKTSDRFHNFSGHDYDFDELETRLLNQN